MKYIYTIPWRICVLKWPLSQLASWLIFLSKKIRRTMFKIKWSSKTLLFQNGSNVVTFSETDSSTTNEKSDGKYCLQRLNTQDSITVTYQIHYKILVYDACKNVQNRLNCSLTRVHLCLKSLLNTQTKIITAVPLLGGFSARVTGVMGHFFTHSAPVEKTVS